MELNGKSYGFVEVSVVPWEEGISVDVRMKEDYDVKLSSWKNAPVDQ